MKKRLLSLLLCAVMLLSMFSGAISVYADEPLPFTDVKAGDWFYGAVESVYATGIMKGKTDTTFDPKANMSRAEFVTVLSRIAAVNAAMSGYSDSLNFTDTDPDAWYADAAGWAVETGLSTGTSATTFSPTREITRQEMAVLIVRFVKYLGENVPDNAKVDKFADADKIADWAKADIETMRKYGLIQGDQGGNFNPLGKADRASVATIAMRLLPLVTTNYIVENGKSDYVIVKGSEDAANAAERVQYQIEYMTGAKLDIVDSTKSAKAIVVGGTDIDTSGLKNDSYRIKIDGDMVKIDGATAEGIYKGAAAFVKAHCFDGEVKFTNCAEESYDWTAPIGKLTVNGNDISKYKIVHAANASEKTMIGVNDMIEYIEKATGVKLEATSKTSDYAIIVEEKIVKVAGAGSDLDSFKIKSEGNSIRLTGAAERGAMYACYELLEQIGWRFLMEDVDYIRPAAEKDLSGLDLTESSVFYNRTLYSDTCLSSIDMRNKHRYAEGLKYTGRNCHTFDDLDGDFSKQYESQPCLTNPEVFDLMLKNVMALLDKNPDAKLISVSQNDNVNYCECDNCVAAMKKYATNPDDYTVGGPAGLVVEFVNKIAVEVVKKYPNVLIHTFAYQYSEHVPAGIKPHDNVVIQLCSINNCFNHSLAGGVCGHNTSFEADIKAWGEISKTLFIWDYNNNFAYRATPFTNLLYDTLAGNMQLFADNNAKGLFLQGNGSLGNNGEFDRLRWYLLAKLAWDPYMSEDEYYTHMREFMEGFYGEGWESVYEALFLLHEKYQNSHLGIYDSPIGNWMHTKFQSSIDTLIGLMDDAKLKSDSYVEFCSIDASEIQFDYIYTDIHFDKLYKSGDEDKIRESQEICFRLQNKMQKYGVRLSDAYGIPNFTEFTQSATHWKELME